MKLNYHQTGQSRIVLTWEIYQMAWKLDIFLSFQNIFFHFKLIGPLIVPKTKTIFCGVYTVDYLHSKWLFLFLYPCLIVALWLFHLFFSAFSYMSIIRAKIIQECACWKSSQAHHHSLKVTAWSINQWLPNRTSQPVIHKWVRHSTELLFDTLTLAFALTIAEILLQSVISIELKLQVAWRTHFQDFIGLVTL